MFSQAQRLGMVAVFALLLTTSLSLAVPAQAQVFQQVVVACPNRPPFQTGAVAALKLMVGGGQPASGYTWTVTPGNTLPPSIVLDNLTGVIHSNGNPASIPAAGQVLNIPLTVTDQISTIHSAPNVIVLQVQTPGNNIPCGVPVFQVIAGPIPLNAVPDVSYGAALPVEGGVPPYTWSLNLQKGDSFPPELTLDKTTGVVRGTPLESRAGQSFTFHVTVKDSTGAVALEQNAYVLAVCGANGVSCPAHSATAIPLQLPGVGGGALSNTDTHDFDGDGKSDIAWFSLGEVAIWLMDGGSVSSVGVPGGASAGWSIVGQRDFNGDGKADLLWYDSGSVAIWFMNGTQVSSIGSFGNVGGTWTVAGTGDFNGDGKGDILWTDTSGDVAIWLMNGQSLLSASVLGNVGTGWFVAGVGDFNGDGKADILWTDNIGDYVIWFMNGTQVSSVASLGYIPGTWSIVGTGDFNDDGDADILWRDSAGDLAVWLMNGVTVSSVASLGNVSPVWSVVQTGDYNGDGKSDILWRDTNGDIAAWFMNGASVSSVISLGNVPTTWRILGDNTD